MNAKMKIISSIVLFLLFSSTLIAQTPSFVVTNINNSGTGSLRQAIINAVATTSPNVTISFNLPNGNNTITLLSEIVMNSQTTGKIITINGYTTAKPLSKIIVKGTGTRSINGIRNTSTSMVNFNIYGLQFENFLTAVTSSSFTTIGAIGNNANIFINNYRAIYLTNSASIVGNYIGTDKNFTIGLGNYIGIEGYGTSRTVSVNSNYLAKNTYAVYIHPLRAGSAYITNNIIGTNNTAATRTDLGNTYVYTGYDANNGTSSAYFENNTIAYTTTACLLVDIYEMRRNNFVCNGGTLLTNRTTPYATPVITSVTPNQYGGVTITGTSFATNDSIFIFQRDPTVCSTTPCQGSFIGVAKSNAARQWTAYVVVAPGKQITAIATLPGYNDVDVGYRLGSSSQLTGCYTIPCPAVGVSFQASQNVSCYKGFDGVARLTITPNGYTYFNFNYNVVSATSNTSVATGTVGLAAINIQSLSAGTYRVIITNPINLCTYTSSNITITEPSAPLSTTTCRELTPVTTTTSNDAVGQVVVSGGTPPYTLTITRPTGATFTLGPQASGTFNIPALAPGNYGVTAIDAAYSKGNPKTGCTATCSFTISTATCRNIRVAVQTVNNVSCNGNTTGSLVIKYGDLATNLPLTLTASNGFSQTITTFSNDSTATIPNLRAGTYTITLRNRLNCTVSTTATVSEPAPLTVTCDTVIPAQRVGEASGSAKVTLRGGTARYTLVISGAANRTYNSASPIQINIDTLRKGNYVATVYDSYQCFDTCHFTILEPICTGFNVIPTIDSIRCFGEKNGRITLNDTNAVSPLTYAWSSSAIGNQPIADNLDVGTYRVTITDDRNCKDTVTATITTPSVLTTNFNKTDVAVVGQSTGRIAVTVSGGTPIYDVNLTMGGTPVPLTNQTGNTFNFNNLPKGTYIAVTTDARGCSKIDTIRINDPNCNFTITGQADSVRCYGGNDGAITITHNVPGVGVTYAWSQTGMGNTPTPTNLRAGIYSVTATTLANCADTLSIDVYQPDSMSVSAFPTDVSIVGGSNGRIDVTVSGGTLPYRVTRGSIAATPLSPTSFVFNNLPKGTYLFTVTDANGCSTSQSLTINDPICEMDIDSQVDSVSCAGTATGRITLVVNNSLGTLSYAWNPASIGNTGVAQNLNAGAYAVTVMDSRRCTVSTTINVYQPNPLTTTHLVNDVTIVGGTDGRITVNVRGGIKPYIVNRDSTNATETNDSTFVFNNLPVGTYTFTATDANGCSTSQTVTVRGPICNMTMTSQVTPVRCKGGATGSITVTVTNGVGGLTYAWTPPSVSTTNIANNLPAGTYSVTATDARRCTTSTTMTVTEPSLALSATGTATAVTTTGGTDGRIDVLVRGGTKPYTVVRGTTNATRNTDSTFVFNGLTSGNYTFTVTDANGCTTSQTVTVGSPICEMSISSQVVPVRCKGAATGSITVTVTNGVGGLTYAWTPPSVSTTNIANNLTAGTYSVTATDSRRCTTSTTVTVTEPSLALSATGTATAVTTTGGTDGRIDVLVRGGTRPYTVVRGTTNATRNTDSTFVFNGLTSGNYTFTVTDANGCTTSQSVTVGSPNCNMTMTSQVVPVACKGGATGRITVTVTNGVGALAYAWTPPSVSSTDTAKNLTAGTYSVTATDARRCTTSTTATVTEPSLALSAAGTPTAVTTIGGTDGRINVIVRGGTQPYTVVRGTTNATRNTDSTFVFNGLTSGNYTFTVTDANGCTTSQTVTVGNPDCNITTQINITQVITCFGASNGALNVVVQNAQTPQYNWTPNLGNTPNPSNLPAGTYTLTVMDARGCSATAQRTLTEPAQIRASMVGDTAICNGQTAKLRFVVENAATFTLTITNGVDTIRPTTLEATVLPTATTTFRLLSVQSGVCTGLISDNNRAIVTVTTPSVPTGLKAEKDSLCAGSELRLSVNTTTATQYIWQTPNGNVTTTVPLLTIANVTSSNSGSYAIRTVQNGCSSVPTTAITVRVFTMPTEKANAGIDKLVCDQTVTTLSATAVDVQNVRGRWTALNSGILAVPTSNVTSVTNLTAGIHRFVWILTSAVCGEVSRDTVVVSVSAKPDLASTQQINLDSKLTTVLINSRELLKDKTLDPALFNLKITKSPDKAKVIVQNNGIYFDRNDLMDAETIEIEFEVCSKICPTVCSKGKLVVVLKALADDTDFSVPKVFSINNRNGSSLEINGLDFFLDNEITIVNRWGAIVFGPTAYKNNHPEKSWDARKNGKPLPTGAYYYFIRYNILKVKKGIIYLVEE